eukprot:gene19692-30345_t
MASAAVVDGLGVDNAPADSTLTIPMLKKIAAFCEKLMVLEKPKKDVIEYIKTMAEEVGNVDIVAGVIARHIKFSEGPKLLLCWYTLDILAKKHPETFGQAFGPQIEDLAVNHMNWTDAKEDAKYTKLIETWERLFGSSICSSIMAQKELVKAEHAAKEHEKAERVARGLPAEAPKVDDDKGPTWESSALVLGGVKDGQIAEYVAPCKWYLIGICSNPKCSRPHPPGLFGSVDAKKVLGDWICRKCGYKNPGGKNRCWRRDCTGTKPEALPVPKQALENPFKEQFGYDPEDEAAAVAHYKDTDWAQWREDRAAGYKKILLHCKPAASGARAEEPPPAFGEYCHSCAAQLKAGAAFCWRCGQRQLQEPAPPPEQQQEQYDDETERDDLLFPSTRLTVPDVNCPITRPVANLLRLCREVVRASSHLSYLEDIVSSLREAVSHIYSVWAWNQRPPDATVAFLTDLGAMRAVLPLQDIDEEMFETIASDASASQASMQSSDAPQPKRQRQGFTGTISL